VHTAVASRRAREPRRGGIAPGSWERKPLACAISAAPTSTRAIEVGVARDAARGPRSMDRGAVRRARCLSGIVERWDASKPSGRLEPDARLRAGSVRLSIRAGFDAPPPRGLRSVNGVCLTWSGRRRATSSTRTRVPRRWRTPRSGARPRRRVNLERALPGGGRAGGHWVSGHVDSVRESRPFAGREATCSSRSRSGLARPYVAVKGSIAHGTASA